MSHKQLDEDALVRSLRLLPTSGHTLFLLSCAERLLPNYAHFVKVSNWGDETRLAEGLSYVWSAVGEGKVPDENAVRRLQSRVEEVAPDTEDFESIYVSSALDATTVVDLALQSLLCPSLDLLFQGSRSALDSVDMYIQEIECMEEAQEDQILAHPLMQNEIRQQLDALELIASWVSGGHAVGDLEEVFRNRPSNLGIQY